MADTEDSAAAILPQEKEEKQEEREEEDVKSKVQVSDPAPESSAADQPQENGTVNASGGEDIEGAEAEQPQPEEKEEQLVVEEEDGDRDEQQQQQQQLGPRDEIKVTVTGYQRTGDNCTFDVEVEVNSGKAKTVHRTYHDLLWLHRNLTRRVELGGYILPPMAAPPPKAPDTKVAVLGETSRALFGDHNRLPCLAVEVLLQALADHRFFAENDTVHTYIAKDQVSTQDPLGGGSLWSQITKSVSDYQLNSVQAQDTDEEFSKFLKYIESLMPQLQACARSFAQMVTAQQSLAVAIVISTELLEEHAGWEVEKNDRCSSVLQKLVEGMDEEKQYLHSASLDGRHTIGFTFDLYHKYCQQAKEMLYRRLHKLQQLVNCNNQLEKAKPQKKEEAEKAKEAADEAFKSITTTAKKEIELFHQNYTKSFQSNLLGFAESQIEHSRKTFDNLARLRDQLAAL